MKSLEINRVKNRKIFWIITLSVVIVAGVVIFTLAKYAEAKTDTHIQLADKFYFTSDTLKETEVVYTLNDWNIASNYTFTINLKNFEDTLRRTDENINYNIQATTTNNKVNIALSSTSGTITTSEGSDNITITISLKNGQTLNTLEEVPIIVTATSMAPYQKSITARFNIYEKDMDEYKALVIDSVGREYAVLTIKTNNITGNKIFSYDKTNLILDNTNALFVGKNITTNGNTNSVSLVLESNSNYIIEFIKLNPNAVTVFGTDININ